MDEKFATGLANRLKKFENLEETSWQEGTLRKRADSLTKALGFWQYVYDWVESHGNPVLADHIAVVSPDLLGQIEIDRFDLAKSLEGCSEENSKIDIAKTITSLRSAVERRKSLIAQWMELDSTLLQRLREQQKKLRESRQSCLRKAAISNEQKEVEELRKANPNWIPHYLLQASASDPIRWSNILPPDDIDDAGDANSEPLLSVYDRWLAQLAELERLRDEKRKKRRGR
jgi:hypothetical protein